jgi:hypothetical protein
LADGYRAAISFGETTSEGLPIVHDTVVVFEDAATVPPGGTATARAWVTAPEHLPDELAPGRELRFCEGARTVAHARLLEVLRDPSDHPIGDHREAKTRPLVRSSG